MKCVLVLAILGIALLGTDIQAVAAPAPSNWPSLSYDAAASDDNTAEHTLGPGNVLKLKVLWASPIADVSYPVVAGGRVFVPFVTHAGVHVKVLNTATGKQTAVFTKQAQGGMLVLGNTLYVAGKYLQQIDRSSGQRIAQIDASPHAGSGTFLQPVADQKIIAVGYASLSGQGPASSSMYAVDPSSNRVLWHSGSRSAEGAIGEGRVMTQTDAGSSFYDESTGKTIAKERSVYGDWFAGNALAYTVASIGRAKANLFAIDGSGHRVWKRVVGPDMIAAEWPHAVSSNALYVQTLMPRSSVVDLDPESGTVQWSRAVASIQRMVLANGVLYVLTYGLGQPVRLVMLRADSGHPIGTIVLSSGYNAFNAPNGLMVAGGMVFIRAVGPKGSQLLALGLPHGRR